MRTDMLGVAGMTLLFTLVLTLAIGLPALIFWGAAEPLVGGGIACVIGPGFMALLALMEGPE